jgi:hypothetical protein
MARDPNDISATLQRITDLEARRAAAATAQTGAIGAAAGDLVAEPPQLRRIYIQGGEYQ